MCVAVPARVESLMGTKALINAFGFVDEVDVRLLSDLRIGDFVLVHVGFAIQKLTPAEAEQSVEIWCQALAAEQED